MSTNPDLSFNIPDFNFIQENEQKRIDKNIRFERGFIIMYNRVGDCKNKVIDTKRGINNINQNL